MQPLAHGRPALGAHDAPAPNGAPRAGGSYARKAGVVGRHSARRAARQVRHVERERVVEMVDCRTGQAHWLTPDAAAAGYPAEGQYVAICGRVILPASMATPPKGWCEPCRSIPAQRVAR
jgi:hypothetical protein